MIEVPTISIDEQIQTYLDRGVDAEALAALREQLTNGSTPPRSVLVPSRSVMAISDAATKIERDGQPVVFGHLEPDELETFTPIDAIRIPDSAAYLATDIDLGSESRNVTPEQALADILAAGRSPLTIDEGIALMLQQPDSIAKNWGFSMAGARRADQRVPAFWVSGGRPKLGWCWDRNPHTWLGTASCAERLEPTEHLAVPTPIQ